MLRMGADEDTTTVLHFAEYLADVPEKVRVRRYRKIVGPAGHASSSWSRWTTRTGWSSTIDSQRGLLRPDPARLHRVAAGAAGDSGLRASGTIDAADLVAFGAKWMTTNLR